MGSAAWGALCRLHGALLGLCDERLKHINKSVVLVLDFVLWGFELQIAAALKTKADLDGLMVGGFGKFFEISCLTRKPKKETSIPENGLVASIVKEVDVELIDAAVAGGVHDQGTAAPAAARVSCVHAFTNS